MVGGQSLPGAAGHRHAHGMGRVGRSQHARGCAAGLVRRAGHHSHQLPRTGAADRREPGHLPVGHHHAVGARGQDRARLLVLWRLVRLCLVRGRNRPVLGPLTGTGIPEPGPGPIARHGEAGPGSGRHRRRLDLPVRARGSHGQERSGATACVAGLVPEVRTQEPAQRGRGGIGGGHGQAVPGRARPDQVGVLWPQSGSSPRCPDGGQPGDRRLRPGIVRRGVHGPRERLPQDPGRVPGDPLDGTRRCAGAAGGCCDAPDRPGDAAWHCRTRRRRRGRRRRGGAALRQECPGDDRCRQGQARGAAGQPAAGRRDRHHLRPQRADRAGHSQSHDQARRRVSGGGAGLRTVPLASSFCAGGHHLATSGRDDGVLGHALPGHQRQHHVAGGDCHRRGGDGGCSGGDDRERPQEAGGLAARAPRSTAAGQGTVGRDHTGRGGSRSCALLLAAHHHALVHPGLHPRSAGRPAVRPAGVHQDLRDGRGRRAVSDADSRTHGLLDSRAYPG